ncbi:copper resistance protein B [Sphingomonas baiyangensis]|uniref:Copper resistance protein B n=1 Tax=Sphingomonas baiyangensis TaxID=2572576 RepID=A0A4U1L884_9SPHN|nr:copper resistance protein B [Sphingomonas baiyangensis]TKD53171.1 copper resistance protein B [Sphingomonas baiyangensis]
MSALLIAALALATPQHAGHAAPPPQASTCTPEHAAMGHCTLPAAPPPPPPPACTPEHAAMGHCALPAAPAPPSAPACTPEHVAMGHCTLPAAPAPPSAPACTPEHAAMGHCTLPVAPAPPPPPACTPEHAAMGHCTLAPAASAPAGNAPPPPAPRADYADRIWGAQAMAASRAALRREHGGGSFSQVMIDIAEVQFRRGREGYRWEGEGWFGGDINRLVVKTEGEGEFGDAADDAEAQALYSRAIGPYFNLQAGVRQDFAPVDRTYAAFGVEGLAPYWFEVEAHAFVSTEGDVLGRLAASYDQRITQRLILQPRVEFNLAAQDVPESGIGAGLSDGEFDLRLRYEIVREFAPYVGVSHGSKFGRTADYARAVGEDASATTLVAGIRAWF